MNAGHMRMRIAVLWLAAAVTYAFGMLMYLLVIPGALEEALAGQMEGNLLDGFAGYWLAMSALVPLGMAIMALLGDNRATGWASVGVGLLYGALTALDTVGIWAEEGLSGAVPLFLLLAGIVFLIAGLSFAELRKPPSPAASNLTEHREKATA